MNLKDTVLKQKIKNEQSFKILNFDWINLICLKILNIQMSLMQCKNSKIQNAINNIFFVMLYSNMD